MTSSNKLGSPTAARRHAVGFVILCGIAVAACVPPPPGPGYPAPGYGPPGAGGFAPGAGPGYPPGGPAGGYEAGPPGAGPGPTGPGYAAARPGGASLGAAPGAGRGMTREQFIEGRRQAAIARGADPERAAANAARTVAQMDANRDGILDPSERAAWRASRPGQNRQANPAQWQQPDPQR